MFNLLATSLYIRVRSDAYRAVANHYYSLGTDFVFKIRHEIIVRTVIYRSGKRLILKKHPSPHWYIPKNPTFPSNVDDDGDAWWMIRRDALGFLIVYFFKLIFHARRLCGGLGRANSIFGIVPVTRYGTTTGTRSHGRDRRLSSKIEKDNKKKNGKKTHRNS